MSSILGEISFPTQLLLSFALGEAASPALRPYTQDLANAAWASNAVLPPDAYQLAQGVAQGQVDPKQAASWAAEQGIGGAQFAALVQIANVGPPLGLAFEAWRRGQLTQTQFKTALTRLAIEPQWFAALEDLKTDRLDLGAIATAVHRGIMADDGLLVTPAPTGSGNVPAIPVSNLDTIAEFAAQGIDPERARILIADTGLPLSLGEMLQLYNRGVVTDVDVKRAVSESNIRNEYMDVALDLSRRLLTPHEYAEADLRGVMTSTDAAKGAGLSGFDPADYATLVAIIGRPLNVHEITTGEARGGTYGGTYTDVPAGPYRDAIRRSAIRPEYASLAYANRYTYPSAFVLRSLAQAGEIGDAAAVQQVLEEIGWSPTFAKQVAAAWVGGGATGDPHEAKAQTQLWTATHRSYIAHEISDPTATTALEAAGVSAAAVPGVLTLWQAERDLIRKSLSAAQVKKAMSEAVTNPATGVPWTAADAVARLLELGYDTADANTFLDL